MSWPNSDCFEKIEWFSADKRHTAVYSKKTSALRSNSCLLNDPFDIPLNRWSSRPASRRLQLPFRQPGAESQPAFAGSSAPADYPAMRRPAGVGTGTWQQPRPYEIACNRPAEFGSGVPEWICRAGNDVAARHNAGQRPADRRGPARRNDCRAAGYSRTVRRLSTLFSPPPDKNQPF